MKKSNIVLGIVSGAAIGLLMGILLAPEKGTKTRKKLKKQGNVALDQLKDKAYILAAYVNEVNNEIDRLSDKIEASLEQGAYKAAGKVGEAFSKIGDGKKRSS